MKIETRNITGEKGNLCNNDATSIILVTTSGQERLLEIVVQGEDLHDRVAAFQEAAARLSVNHIEGNRRSVCRNDAWSIVKDYKDAVAFVPKESGTDALAKALVTEIRKTARPSSGPRPLAA